MARMITAQDIPADAGAIFHAFTEEGEQEVLFMKSDRAAKMRYNKLAGGKLKGYDTGKSFGWATITDHERTYGKFVW